MAPIGCLTNTSASLDAAFDQSPNGITHSNLVYRKCEAQTDLSLVLLFETSFQITRLPAFRLSR